MSVTLKANLDQIIDRALADQRIVGAVLLISRDGEFLYKRAAGFADREAGIPMREDAIFRLSSLSKPMVSAAALALIERGQLHLDAAITQWIPEFQPSIPDGTTPEITIRQLLTHTAGLSYRFLEPDDGPYAQANVSDGLDQPGLSMAENLRRIASVPLSFPPGTAWSYSVAIDILGEAIARASRSPLPDAVRRLVTAPLAMPDTGFAVTDPSRLAVPYANASPRPVRMGELQSVKLGFGPGSVRFAPSRAFDLESFPSGGCGMVGTAGDFWKFLEALRAGGARILSSESARAMTTHQTGDLGPGPGMGFAFGASVLLDPAAAQTPQSPGTIAWGGVYGHSWFVDLSKDLIVVSLTNTAIEGMSGQFPAQIRDAVYRNES